MKYYLSECILLSCLPLLASAQDLVWSEEFDAETGLNSSTWSYDLGADGWGNAELQNYVESAVTVDNGSLKIKADQNQDGNYTSGRINTKGKFMFKYGTLEARINAPNLDAGLWPAFWTMGSNVDLVGWPAAGEIDIFEMGQGLAVSEGKVNQRVVSAAHWEFNDTYATHAQWKDANSTLTGNFHNYTLEWTKDYLRTYFDEIMIFEMNISEDLCKDCTELHQFHFIILNMAVGGRFTYSGEESSPGSMSSQPSTLSNTPCTNSFGTTSSFGTASSSGGVGTTSSEGVGTASSGGCGVRTGITAPLPAVLEVEYIHLYNNEHTEIFSYQRTTEPSSPPPKDDVMPSPTSMPTSMPTKPAAVIFTETTKPTDKPTKTPSSMPTDKPTDEPTNMPTNEPTSKPTTPAVVTSTEPDPAAVVEPEAASPDHGTASVSSGKSGSSSGKSGKSGSGKKSGSSSGKKSGSSGKKSGSSGKSGKSGKSRGRSKSDDTPDDTLQTSTSSLSSAAVVPDSSSTNMVHPSWRTTTFGVLVALCALINL